MQKLYVITQTFPLDKGEDTFIGPEMPFLQKEFDVTFVPLEKCTYSAAAKAIAALKAVFKVRLYTEIFKNKKRANGFFKLAGYAFFMEWRATLYAGYLDKNVFEQGEQALVYSYWFNEICLAPISLKNKYPNYKFVTRAHGYDLYDERLSAGVQPYKEYMDKHLCRVIFVSNEGKQYYLNRYNLQNSDKYTVKYLGVKKAEGFEYKAENDKELRIVSCSYVIGIKRVELIINALEAIDDIQISWTHTGDGSDLEKITSLAKAKLQNKKNITYKFNGYMKNENYLEFLKEYSPQVFLTVSSTEGLPVSLMEACSMAIPCIATNVGGISELVDHTNGCLMPANPTPQQLATAISDFYRLSLSQKIKKSDNSYKIWQEKFNSQANSKEFVRFLKSI